MTGELERFCSEKRLRFGYGSERGLEDFFERDPNGVYLILGRPFVGRVEGEVVLRGNAVQYRDELDERMNKNGRTATKINDNRLKLVFKIKRPIGGGAGGNFTPPTPTGEVNFLIPYIDPETQCVYDAPFRMAVHGENTYHMCAVFVSNKQPYEADICVYHGNGSWCEGDYVSTNCDVRFIDDAEIESENVYFNQLDDCEKEHRAPLHQFILNNKNKYLVYYLSRDQYISHEQAEGSTGNVDFKLTFADDTKVEISARYVCQWLSADCCVI